MTVEQRIQANVQAMLGERDFQIALLAARLDDAMAKIAELEKEKSAKADVLVN